MQYIISRTPCRISLFGGGTDFESFINKNGQANILSFTIDKFVYSLIKKNNLSHKIFNEKYRLNYFKSEKTKSLGKIKNKIVKKILTDYDKINPYYISLFSDIPSGNGLGSSSAFIVGMIKSFYKIKKIKIDLNKIFAEAVETERKTINKNTGLQDQAAATFGGFNHFTFKKNKVLIVRNLEKYKSNLNKIINNSFLIWTEDQRDSSKILGKQKKNIRNKIKVLKKMDQISLNALKLIKSKNFNLKKFAEILKYSYTLKISLANGITNKNINKILKILDYENALGYKILGAGGGGFILCVMNKNKKEKFFNKYKNKFKMIDYSFQNSSTQFLFYK